MNNNGVTDERDVPTDIMVAAPPHYQTEAGLEAWDVIEATWGLQGHMPAACKYILRAGRKGDAVQDLNKARAYIKRILRTGDMPPATPFSGVPVGKAAHAFGLTPGLAIALGELVHAATMPDREPARRRLHRCVMALDAEIKRQQCLAEI